MTDELITKKQALAAMVKPDDIATKAGTERQRRYRERQRQAGRRQYTYYLTPEEKAHLDEVLRVARKTGEKKATVQWTRGGEL